MTNYTLELTLKNPNGQTLGTITMSFDLNTTLNLATGFGGRIVSTEEK